MNYIFNRGCLGSQKVLVFVARPARFFKTNPLKSGCPILLCRDSTSKRLMSTIASRTSSPFNAGSIFLLSIPIGTFCLGTWQYQRRKWKLNLMAELKEKTSAPPVDLPQDLHDLDEMEYQRVKITGSFDHDKEVYMGPRSLLVRGDVRDSGGSSLISSGQSGYNVITPFKLADRDLTILVNRGWVSRKQRNPETRPEGQLEGELNLTAIVRKTENRPPFTPDNTKDSLIFIYRDVNTMARMTNTAPVCIDAIETLEGGPQGGQTRVTLRNEHLSYMITWYSLSIATAYLWVNRYVRGKPLM